MNEKDFRGKLFHNHLHAQIRKTYAHCSKSSFFVQKFNFDFPRKLSIILGWKTRENVVVLDFIAVDNFDFTRKIVKKFGVKNLWRCWSFVKIEFLDKNLTFRIECYGNKGVFILYKAHGTNWIYDRKINWLVHIGPCIWYKLSFQLGIAWNSFHIVLPERLHRNIYTFDNPEWFHGGCQRCKVCTNHIFCSCLCMVSRLFWASQSLHIQYNQSCSWML